MYTQLYQYGSASFSCIWQNHPGTSLALTLQKAQQLRTWGKWRGRNSLNSPLLLTASLTHLCALLPTTISCTPEDSFPMITTPLFPSRSGRQNIPFDRVSALLFFLWAVTLRNHFDSVHHWPSFPPCFFFFFAHKFVKAALVSAGHDIALSST